jgi:ABC-type Fe3+/spermidine/putrescine transport system ATPase subunit
MTENPKTILEVRGISNNYGGEPLLQDINFSITRGEILSLLGPSGSGKTTLLRLLAGLEKEDSGTIFFCGQNIKPIAPHKRNIGMMFQEYALFPHKNVWQNVAFGLEMQNHSAAVQNRKVEKMLDLVGLTGFGRRQMNELSGGERQRVALARSLAPEPQLLLLDEPLGSLDRTLRDRLTGEIRAILKTIGVTAVFVTHDQAEAFSVADKVAILHKGILQQFDTPERIYLSPANSTVARFLGFQNLIKGEIDANNIFNCPLGAIEINDTTVSKTHTTVLIRPDIARIVRTPNQLAEKLYISGIVTSRIFQGSSYRITLEVLSAAGPVTLSFDLANDPIPPKVNQSIDLSISLSKLIMVGEQLKE